MAGKGMQGRAQSGKGNPKPPRRSGPSQQVIPDAVANRMARRIAIGTGIPTVMGGLPFVVIGCPESSASAIVATRPAATSYCVLSLMCFEMSDDIAVVCRLDSDLISPRSCSDSFFVSLMIALAMRSSALLALAAVAFAFACKSAIV